MSASLQVVHVDVEDPVASLGEVTLTAALHDCSLVCAWSVQVKGNHECM